MIVGASGTILTNLMAKAMNRSIPAIVAGGFGGVGHHRRRRRDDGVERTVRSTSAADAAIQMAYANQVVVVPGYGMAVAQAQHAVREMAKLLEAKGVEVEVRDPPGRRPHAGAHERAAGRGRRALRRSSRRWTTSTREFGRTDVSLVIGANDVTNPDARDKADSPDLRHADPQRRRVARRSSSSSAR